MSLCVPSAGAFSGVFPGGAVAVPMTPGSIWSWSAVPLIVRVLSFICSSCGFRCPLPRDIRCLCSGALAEHTRSTL
eukprot:4050628-Prymnesium_polylepis.1